MDGGSCAHRTDELYVQLSTETPTVIAKNTAETILSWYLASLEKTVHLRDRDDPADFLWGSNGTL